MMKKLVFLCIFIGSAQAAIPTMAVPNLVYSADDDISVSTTASTGENTTNAAVAKQVKKELPGFNADVRGTIISSGRFKVVTMPKQNTLWTGNPQMVLDYVKTNTPKTAEKNTASQTMAANIRTSSTKIPDYILLGEVSAITQNQDFTPIKDTDKSTNQYNIDIAVDYKLIKTSDDSVMASFTAYGHANDVKILTNGSTAQVQTHNVPLLIKTASKNLGTDVITQLNEQFGTSSENYNNGSKVVTEVKVYN
jgi:hypothetical protein